MSNRNTLSPAVADTANAVRASRNTTQRLGKRARRAAKKAERLTPAAQIQADRCDHNEGDHNPDAPANDVPATDTQTRGRKSLIATLSPDDIKAQIDDLLRELRATTDADAKKRIRRALRLRGHRGGLSHERAEKAATNAA